MRRFLKGLVSGLIPIIMIGALALVALGDLGSDAVTAADVMAQVEDDADEVAGDSPAPGASLTPIEAYLAKILPPDGEGQALPSAQRVVLSRDPFNPVVPADADGTTDGGGTDDGTDGTDGDGTDGTDGDGTDGDGTDGADVDEDVCSGDETEVVCDGFVVTLDTVTDDDEVIVSVNGTTFTVGVGDEFATSFRVLAINPPCATLLFGDEAFSICTGVTVLK